MAGRGPILVLLVVLVVPSLPLGAAHPPTAPDFRLVDATDDVQVTAASQSSPPVSAPWADLVRLEIVEETDHALVIEAAFQDLAQGNPPPSQDWLALDIRFQLEGQDVGFYIRHSFYGGPDPAFPDRAFVLPAKIGDAIFCYVIGAARADDYCFSFYLKSEFRPADSAFRYRLTKDMLARPDPSTFAPTPFEGDLSAGKKISGIGATSTYRHAYLYLTGAAFQDELPDGGVSDRTYAFNHEPPNVQIQARLEPAGQPSLYYRPGDNHTFAFTVANLGPSKMLVRPTYTVEGAPEDVAKFQVYGPSALSVPAGQTRGYKFFVQNLGLAGPVRLALRADSVVGAHYGYSEAWLEPGLTLAPGENTLHVVAGVGSQWVEGTCPAAAAVPFACGIQAMLSATKPRPGFEQNRASAYEGYNNWIDGLDHLAQPLAFSQEPFQAQLNLATLNPQGYEATVTAELSYLRGAPTLFGATNATVLFTASAAETVTPEGTVFKFSGKTKFKEPVLPAHGTFRLNYHIGGSSSFFLVTGTEVRVADSFVRLPLAPVPEAYLEKPNPSPFQITLRGDRDDFVNAGKARLFNLTVLNYNAQDERLRLSARADRDWKVELLPGDTFDLRPGESIGLGVLVHAPREAQDGDQVHVSVNATDDQGTSVGARLTLTVVTQIDFSDDTGRYDADSEDLAKLVQGPKQKAPGLLFIGCLLAWGFAASRAHRRRESAGPNL